MVDAFSHSLLSGLSSRKKGWRKGSSKKVCKREREREIGRQSECVCMSINGERESMCVEEELQQKMFVCVRERKCVCVCVCMGEKEIDRKRM